MPGVQVKRPWHSLLQVIMVKGFQDRRGQTPPRRPEAVVQPVDSSLDVAEAVKAHTTNKSLRGVSATNAGAKPDSTPADAAQHALPSPNAAPGTSSLPTAFTASSLASEPSDLPSFAHSPSPSGSRLAGNGGEVGSRALSRHISDPSLSSIDPPSAPSSPATRLPNGAYQGKPLAHPGQTAVADWSSSDWAIVRRALDFAIR
jgi:hypothetical protein